MGGELISIVDIAKMRFHQFHARIKSSCVSEPVFHQRFLIRRNHIDQSAAKDPDSLRLNIGDEQVASVITGGMLNVDESKMKGTAPEIAIEAKFIDFPWMDLADGRDKVEPVVCVRVVIREGTKQDIVVTAYVPRREDLDLEQLNEVPYEIW